ncbi:MAG: hypothetical protein JNM13_06655 [Hyphomicrobiaceae bacterium]|nr:hypothetical protein [Hyphomicrobiaceae bacterium]
MYGLTNKVENLSSLDIYCAYSAPASDGGFDVWRVGLLKSRSVVTDIDIDYIRAAKAGTTLSYTNAAKQYFKTGAWIKIRQMVTTSIYDDSADSKNGLILVGGNWTGDPNPALSEALKYDNPRLPTWVPLVGSKKPGRGTEAVKRSIAEWEEILRTSQPQVIGS